MTNGNNDDDKSRDLTRIEDLSEFLHVENSDVDNLFGGFETKTVDPTKTDLKNEANHQDDAHELDPLPELPVDDEPLLHIESEEDNSFSGSSNSEEQNEYNDEVKIESGGISDEILNEEFNNQFDDISNENSSEISNDEFNNQESIELSFSDSLNSLDQDDLSSNSTNDDTHSHESSVEIPVTLTPAEQYAHQERFEEVKNFAQNFSYGQIQGGGNPPFSLVIRNLKYAEDAADILIILREFGLITEDNAHDTTKSLELGSLLIPQISEYSAIVLAHKLRRYDCDLEVGLSDEVHPSKSGDTNPRGLINKDSVAQNKKERFKKEDTHSSNDDIMITSLATLDGFVIKKYLGVHTSFTIVDEEELERLKFVQKTTRSHTELHQYETDEAISSASAFQDYQDSFELLFSDLSDQLKSKAKKVKANALLGLNYQLSLIPFESSTEGHQNYQLICTATLALVESE